MRAPSTATAATTTVTLTAIKTKEKSITKDERRRLDSEWLKMMQQRKIWKQNRGLWWFNRDINTENFTQVCDSTSKSDLHPLHRHRHITLTHCTHCSSSYRKSNWKTKRKTISANNDQRVWSTNGRVWHGSVEKEYVRILFTFMNINIKSTKLSAFL